MIPVYPKYFFFISVGLWFVLTDEVGGLDSMVHVKCLWSSLFVFFLSEDAYKAKF